MTDGLLLAVMYWNSNDREQAEAWFKKYNEGRLGSAKEPEEAVFFRGQF